MSGPEEQPASSHGGKRAFDLEREAARGGAIAWMAKNSVASNLLMVVLLVGGLLVGVVSVKQEVFPEFDMDWITVQVPYPGASPEEVERGILEAVEDNVRGLDGIKKVSSGASEGMGTVWLELLTGVDANKVLADVKNAVDRITSFPQDAERPVVSLMVNRRQVITLVIHGARPPGMSPVEHEKVLQKVAEGVRDELLNTGDITQVEVSGVRPAELAIEVSQEDLRRYGLTLEQVAAEVRRASLELPGGGVKTRGGEVLVRTTERADFGREFERITVLSSTTGTRLRLADIAIVRDGYEDNDQASFFNGDPAVMVQVFRVGDQTPIQIADQVKAYRDTFAKQLPPTLKVATWMDDSEIYRDRIDLLVRNAQLGLILVLLILGLFLKPRLAFWVTLGIPISFMGALMLLPAVGVSINMVSLFAFIITLGMVVDDAIVVGENIHEMREQGVPIGKAAIAGARQVAMPVTFSILTSVVAFMPMLFVPGVMGKIFWNVPTVVILVLAISLVESLFVLPSHLSHAKVIRERGALASVLGGLELLLLPLKPLTMAFGALNRATTGALRWVIDRLYAPSLRVALDLRYATIALGVASLAAAIGLAAGGRIDFEFMPRIESDRVVARVLLPFGSPVQDTEKVQARLVDAAKASLDELGGQDKSRGIFTTLGRPLPARGPVNFTQGVLGGHQASVEVFLVPVDDRTFTAEAFNRLWREKTGQIGGLESLAFSYTMQVGAGAPVDIQLSHANVETLNAAASEVAAAIAAYPGVEDVDDGFSLGKPQLDLRLTDHGRATGVTPSDLARQVRSSFFGAEALRQQRGRDELKVRVRLPEDERSSEHHLEELVVRTPRGGEVPLQEAASVERGRAYTSISRVKGRRVVNVSAEIDDRKTSANKVLAAVTSEVLPEMTRKYPGLTWSFEGEQADMRESMKTLGFGFGLALLAMFALIAIPFRSYLQPLVVMSAVPLGFVGALAGHFIMGFELSVISMMGIVALSGVVVNDSLVLVDAANGYRAEGKDAREAIFAAGLRRFRPILLTSLTTFFGLAPMIFETSVQARFLIPMAISLGFGVLFATFIILVIVPASYLVVEDIKWLFGVGEYGRKKRPPTAQPGPDDAGPDEGELAPA